MLRVRIVVALSLLSLLAGRARAVDTSIDENALRELGVEPTSEAMLAELGRLAGAEVDDAYARKLLHVARLAAAREASDLGAMLVRCHLRLRDPLAQRAVSEAIARIPAGPAMLAPRVLMNTNTPPGVLLACEMLGRERTDEAREMLFALAQERGGWTGYEAAAALRRAGDPRYVPLAKRGLSSDDPMLRLAYFRLLEPQDHPKGFRLFGPPAEREAALRSGQTEPPATPPPPGYVLVQREPNRLVELRPDLSVQQEREIGMALTLGFRPAPGQMLLAVPTRFWNQSDEGQLLWQCTLGGGPQNDVLPLGDGTYLAADGGSFSSGLVEAYAGLYVYDPVSNARAWEVRVAAPHTVRFAQPGTLLVAQGEEGLAWIDGANGRRVRHVSFDAPCLAAEPLDDGDALAAAGSRLVRVDPAGLATWTIDVGGTITSLSVPEPFRYRLTVTGVGVVEVDAIDPRNPQTSVVLPLPEGTSRLTPNQRQ